MRKGCVGASVGRAAVPVRPFPWVNLCRFQGNTSQIREFLEMIFPIRPLLCRFLVLIRIATYGYVKWLLIL